MQSLTGETKLCNACRMQYKKWKKENTEFATILNRLETSMDEISVVKDDLVCFKAFRTLFSRIKNDVSMANAASRVIELNE